MKERETQAIVNAAINLTAFAESNDYPKEGTSEQLTLKSLLDALATQLRIANLTHPSDGPNRFQISLEGEGLRWSRAFEAAMEIRVRVQKRTIEEARAMFPGMKVEPVTGDGICQTAFFVICEALEEYVRTWKGQLDNAKGGAE